MRKFTKFTSLMLAVLLAFSVFSVVGMAESSNVTPDTRFDFIDGTDGVINITGNASAKAENGEFVVTTNSANLANKQVHIELPQFDFGEGGYYMYAKISCELPEGIKFGDSIWGTQTSPGVDWVRAQGGNNWTPWTGNTMIRKFNMTKVTGQQYARIIYLMENTAVTGSLKFHVDWIVLSKNANLNDSTAVLASVSDGATTITLAQDGAMNEAIIENDAYSALKAGTTNGLPAGFTATAVSGISNLAYTTTVTDATSYKLIDITASGTKDGATVFRTYRLLVSCNTFDVDLSNVAVAGDAGATLSTANGNLVLNASGDLSCKKAGFSLPRVDLGQGGYYLHVKAKYNLGQGVGLGSHFASANGTNYDVSNEPWSDYKINSYDITSLSGKQDLNWLVQFTDSSNGDATIEVQTIVLSKEATWSDNNFQADYRYDFIDGNDGVNNITAAATTKVENGEYVVTTNSMNLANKQFHVELPMVDFGEGGYYMYAKISAKLPEGIKFADSMWGSQTAPGIDWVRAQGGNNWTPWNGNTMIRKLNTTGITGEQYVRLIYMMENAAITGVAEFHVDWIVLSKNANLNESTAVLSAINVGGNDVVLAQDGAMTEAVVAADVYNALTTGTTSTLPEGFTATVADSMCDVKYSTTVTEGDGYKVVDILTTGVKSTALYARHYRIKVTEMPASDIRFDFISDTDGVINITGAATAKVENGEFIVTTNSMNLANKQFHVELPLVDFGEGGYYMYAKISADLPEGIQFADSVWGTQTAPGVDWVRAQGGNSWTPWNGTAKIRRLNTTGITGEQYVRMIYMMENAAVTGVTEFHIDWIVLSKNANLNDSTAILASVNDGTNTITLAQDGAMHETILAGEAYNALTAGTTSALPEGFSAEAVDGVSNVTYSTTVTDKGAYKTVDITAAAAKNGVMTARTYRVKVEKLPDPDIRFDFTIDTENVVNTSSADVVESITSKDGDLVITTKNVNLASKQLQFELPQVDLGDGGYYMYVKAKYELPEGMALETPFYGYSDESNVEYPSTGGVNWATWDGYKVLRFDIRSLTGQKFLRMFFKLGTQNVTGVANAYVDWIILSESDTVPTTAYHGLAANITENEGTYYANVVGEYEFNTDFKDVVFYFAGYNVDNALTAVNMVPMSIVGSMEATAVTAAAETLSLSDSDIVQCKVFVWDGELTPVLTITK